MKKDLNKVMICAACAACVVAFCVDAGASLHTARTSLAKAASDSKERMKTEPALKKEGPVKPVGMAAPAKTPVMSGAAVPAVAPTAHGLANVFGATVHKADEIARSVRALKDYAVLTKSIGTLAAAFVAYDAAVSKNLAALKTLMGGLNAVLNTCGAWDGIALGDMAGSRAVRSGAMGENGRMLLTGCLVIIKAKVEKIEEVVQNIVDGGFKGEEEKGIVEAVKKIGDEIRSKYNEMQKTAEMIDSGVSGYTRVIEGANARLGTAGELAEDNVLVGSVGGFAVSVVNALLH